MILNTITPPIEKGNLTAGSNKVTIGGTGTGAVIGSGASVDVAEGNLTHNNIGSLQGGVAGEYNHLSNAQVSALHAAVTIADSPTIDLSLSGQQISGVVLPGGISHNDLASKQGGTTDEYYHLTSAQVSALHPAVTIADTTTIDLSLTGQQISGAVIPGGINHNDLASKQGGTTDEYNHLSNTQVAALHPAVTISDTTTIDLSLTGQALTADVRTDSINDTHIDWGTGTNQVSAGDLPIADAGGYYIGTDAEVALQEEGRSHIDTLDFGFVYNYAGTQQTTIAFDGTNTFTLAPTSTTWAYWRNGIYNLITGQKTVTLSGTPPAAKGLYYIYIDDNAGTLTASTSGWTFEDTKVAVATITWDNAMTPKFWKADERHSVGYGRLNHREHHFADGTEIATRPTLTGYAVAPAVPADADNAFGISQSVIYDEDYKHILSELTEPDGNTAVYEIFYRTAAGVWVWELSAVPFRYTAAGYIQYDNAGTMTQGQGNRFYNTYLLLTNIDGAARFAFIHCQAEFSTLAAATAERFQNLTLTGLPINEFVAVYQLTWESSAAYGTKGKVRLARTPDAINISASTGGIVGSTDHGTLSGLTDDDHTQYLLLAGRGSGQTVVGKLGLGITPLTEFHVDGTSTNTICRISNNTANSSASLQLVNDAKSYQLYISGATDNLAIRDASDGVDRMIVTTAGKIGIGSNVSTPDAMVEILSTTEQLRLTHTDASKFATFTVDTNHDLTVKPSSTGQVILQPTTDSTDFFQVLDADGGTPILNVDATNERVGIGMAAPAYALDVAGNIHAESETNTSGIFEAASNTAAVRPYFMFYRSEGTLASKSAVIDADSLGTFSFRGFQNAAYREAAFINAAVDGTPSGNNVPGKFTFAVNDAAGSTTYHAFTSNGYVAIGTTAADARFEVQTATDDGQQAVTIDQNDADQAFIDFQGTSAANTNNNITTWKNGATLTGYIKVEINGTAYWMPYYTAPTS